MRELKKSMYHPLLSQQFEYPLRLDLAGELVGQEFAVLVPASNEPASTELLNEINVLGAVFESLKFRHADGFLTKPVKQSQLLGRGFRRCEPIHRRYGRRM